MKLQYLVVGYLTLATALALTPNAQALEIQSSVQFSAESTDNAQRIENGDDDVILAPGVNFDFVHDGPNLTLNGGYTVERRFHTENIFSDENATTGNMDLNWKILPNRLNFKVLQARTEASERSFAPQNQDNRQVTSTTELGPLLRFRMRKTDELQFEYTYRDISARETETDSQQDKVSARYVMNLSTSRALTFEINRRKIDYDDNIVPEVKGDTATVRFSSYARDSSLQVTGGYSKFRRDNVSDVTGGIGNISLNLPLGPTTRLTLNADRTIDDQSDQLLRGRVEFGDEFDHLNSDVNEVFVNDSASIGLSQEFGATTVSVNAQVAKEDYEDLPRDSDRQRLRIDAQRQVNPTLGFEVYSSFEKRDFDLLPRDFDQFGVGLRTNWAASNKINFAFDVEYIDREGDDADYDEFRLTATAVYNLLPR